MKIKQVTSFLESIAPLEYQESYDNCGLIIGDANLEVKGALITLDCTEQVIDEAIESGCVLILAGHYATETGGVKAVGQHLQEKFSIKTEFLDYPTGM